MNVLGSRAYFVAYPEQEIPSRSGRSVQENVNQDPVKSLLFLQDTEASSISDVSKADEGYKKFEGFESSARKPRKRNSFTNEWEDRGGYLSSQGAWGSQKSNERENLSSRSNSKNNQPRQPSMKWRLVSSSSGNNGGMPNSRHGSTFSREVYRKEAILNRSLRDASANDPVLVLAPVSQEDHGLYRCRMDYWKSPTTMSYAALYVAGKLVFILMKQWFFLYFVEILNNEFPLIISMLLYK